MFSLISENPFVVLHREANNVWKSNESRMSMLGVNERYIDICQNIKDRFLSLDYKPILPILEEKRAKSLSYLNSVVISASENELGRSDSIDNVRLLSSKKCTGCGLCSLVYPIGAIEMKEDKEGFLGPVVNDSLCKECHLCAERCPSIHPLQKNSIIDAYACISKNKLKEESASGGCFITIAQYYIEVLKGVVYGVVFDNKLVCFHTEATTLKQIIPMQNSKYVQSNMNDIYLKVKERLEIGIRVLFSGTPCQVAGLKSYLHKEYDNLLTVEIVCHGVPNQKFWKYYLQHITTWKVKSYYFRNRNNKKINKTTYEATVEFQDKTKSTVRKILPYEDPYYGPFLKSESFRNSCYYCQYARKDRIADITIGDVDNSKTNREFYPLESKSMLLVNTEKGKELWYDVKGLFNFIPLDYEEESKVNLQLCMPSKQPTARKYLYRDLEMMKWQDFVKKYTTKVSPIKQVILFCLEKLF